MEENQDPIDNRITINGQEYDPTEAQEFIELGRKTREAEQKFNVTFDSIMPAYTKANERAKLADQYETELSEARKTIDEFKSKQNAGTDTQGDLTEAREAARKIGLLTSEDIQGKFLTKDDLENLLSERDRRNEAIAAVNKESEELAAEFNGEDGRPRFNKKVVLAYAQTYKTSSLREAYNDMHADALKSWQDQRVAESKKPGLKTLAEQRGNKEPAPVRPTKENSKDMLYEALWGSKE